MSDKSSYIYHLQLLQHGPATRHTLLVGADFGVSGLQDLTSQFHNMIRRLH